MIIVTGSKDEDGSDAGDDSDDDIDKENDEMISDRNIVAFHLVVSAVAAFGGKGQRARFAFGLL